MIGKTSKLPPGSFGLPIVGETLSFFLDRAFVQKRIERYGSVFKTSLFGRPTVIMAGAKANQFLFLAEGQTVEVQWLKTIETLLGPACLATQSGQVHQSRRKILAQAFQPRALAGYVDTIEAITRDYFQQWTEQSQLTWYPQLKDYTFKVAITLLVGTDANARSLNQLFTTWSNGLFTLPLNLPWTKFGQAVKSRELLLGQIEQIIQQRQQQPDSQTDALGILLQAEDEQGMRLSLAELKDQILLLLFAGHETLTSALASYILLMAQHPHIRQQVEAEQQQFDWQQPLDWQQLKQMTYLEQVLKEVLRLIPPVGGGFRRILKDCEFEGYRLPQGWAVQYTINQTHQDPNIFSQPQQFDPERFTPSRTEDRQTSFGYVPFGGGIRECLGKEFARLELKIFAALLARECEWQLLPQQDLSLVTIPTPHPRDGLRVKIWPK